MENRDLNRIVKINRIYTAANVVAGVSLLLGLLTFFETTSIAQMRNLVWYQWLPLSQDTLSKVSATEHPGLYVFIGFCFMALSWVGSVTRIYMRKKYKDILV